MTRVVLTDSAKQDLLDVWLYIAPGLRYFPIGSYLILYEALPDGIMVVRLVHGARHLSRLLG